MTAHRFSVLRSSLIAGLALAAGVSAFAQAAGDNQCILAGRLGDAGWAPRLSGVQLLGADGRAITSADKQVLAGVKQVRLSAPALLSRCDGNGELALGPDAAGPKSAVPAIGAGVVAVEAVSFPRLRRGGELVELKLTVPAERVSLVTR
ncbi:MAG: hypothetical protein EOO25_20845 [Comamonadaceae bacterium]|nr:MAG: hypothetical protein EOO25_20845 [Comamonadaceae bacterium]